MRPMKVTFVLPYGGMSGGVRVAVIYANLLQRMGHEVTVITQPPPNPGVLDSLRILAREGVWPKRRPPHSVYFENAAFRHVLLDRRRPVVAADAPDADVVVATWWETAWDVAALPTEKGAKVYFIQHHEIHEPAWAERARQTYALPLRKVVIASWLAELMATTYGDPDAALVPNAVDGAQFNAPPRGRQDRPTIGLLYSRKSFKALDVGLAAIERVRALLPTLEVVAFGADPVDPALPLPPGARFHHNPPQDAIAAIYAACDVWLWSSRLEGFGLPIVEAMACRCPVVSTRVGAAIDVIEDGKSGFVTAVDDVDALAEGLRRVLTAPAPTWRAMSDAAYARAHGYGWDDAARLLEDALRSAVEHSATT